MKCLLNERSRFASEGEFIAFVLAEVRRFMRNLRTLNIELALHHGIGKLQQFHSPKKSKCSTDAISAQLQQSEAAN
jgi:hypothetical protein